MRHCFETSKFDILERPFRIVGVKRVK